MNAICTYKRPDAPGGETTGSQSCCHTRTKPAILINWAPANWARVPNPPDCAAPGLHPNRRAAMPEIDGNRQHTMHAEPIGAGETAPDVGTGAL